MGAYKDGQRNTVAAAVSALYETERDKLLRPELGDLSFQSAGEDVDRIRRIAMRVAACDLELVPPSVLQNCQQYVADVHDIFNRMRSFNPMRASTSPVTERDQLVQQCRNLFTTSADRLMATLAIAAPTLSENQEQAKLILESAKSSSAAVLNDVKEETEKAKKEIEITLESVRKATGAIGIEKQAEVFKNAADEHATARGRWLITTMLLSLVTLLALVANWLAAYKLGPPATALGLAQLSVAKVLVFTFLLSAVVWSGKVYRSHQHNYVLNKHRQNALETFQLFARGAEDAETKSMVLLQATKCIFMPQATGFLSGERDADGDSPQILEVIRNLSSTSK